MRKLFFVILATVLFAGCSDDSKSIDAPPSELVGPWISDDPQAIAGGINNGGNPQACNGLVLTQNGVNSGLLKIDSNGLVYDGTQIKDINQPYRLIGSVNSARRFTPTPGTEGEYLGEIAAMGFANAGIAIVPQIDLNVELDANKGATLVMDIKAVFSQNGPSQSMDIGKRNFRHVTADSEKNLISNAALCFEKSQPQP